MSAEEKLQIWLQLLTGELTQRQAAERWGVDPTTIMRIRRVGREGALTALASSKPGGGGRGVVDAELLVAHLRVDGEQTVELDGDVACPYREPVQLTKVPSLT
jgi:transposase-like protein